MAKTDAEIINTIEDRRGGLRHPGLSSQSAHEYMLLFLIAQALEQLHTG